MAGNIVRLINRSYFNESDGGESDDGEGDDLGISLNSLRNLSLGKEKKLLVMHLNGLVAHCFFPRLEKFNIPDGRRPDGNLGRKQVFKRPFCDDFIQFCLSRFDVGIWASAKRTNVDRAVTSVFGNSKRRLLFIWNQNHCTETGVTTLENDDKQIFLKELNKLWNPVGLPWRKGRYTASNTLLIDGSPYRALLYPPNTGIFPESYTVEQVNDDEIGPNGELRAYLEEIAEADDVPSYVNAHSIGQIAITVDHPDWSYYSRIITNISHED
ncbi:hypothetical protein H6P81_003529 [Aristolochia fimbriata]|uniref:Mitochondrial import inner membrane translocase subunit TIM50 n=1 Tax=Aristolochia fimbriata TaxID=158543 RepID=A0AAV7FDW8_ARIFI|nr:hypothetical protein H6P81_003529 [Aristolochia fimbriata]